MIKGYSSLLFANPAVDAGSGGSFQELTVKFAHQKIITMKFSALFFSASIVLASCGFGGDRIDGNGSVTTQERTVSAFDEVEVGGNFKVYVIQGELKPVRIEGDQNLLEYIEFEETGDELKSRTRSGVNLHPTGDMKIYLTSPNFKSIQASGASDILSEGKINNDSDIKINVSGAGTIRMNIDAPAIESGISGSGNIELTGETKDLALRISGAGGAKCFDMKAENTKVEISGAGDADVFASVRLEASVSGAGNVSYKGDPKTVDQHVSGAGSVSKK